MTRWNRHTDKCNGITSTGKACQGCESGSKDRAQRRLYALRVLSAVTGEAIAPVMTCPLTGKGFDIETGEVDRVIPSLGYVPGNVILVSKRGNAARAILQSAGNDVDIAKYVAEVTAASATVAVPSVNESVRWNATRGNVTADDLLGGRY